MTPSILPGRILLLQLLPFRDHSPDFIPALGLCSRPTQHPMLSLPWLNEQAFVDPDPKGVMLQLLEGVAQVLQQLAGCSWVHVLLCILPLLTVAPGTPSQDKLVLSL